MRYLSAAAVDKLIALCPQTLKNLDGDSLSFFLRIIQSITREEKRRKT